MAELQVQSCSDKSCPVNVNVNVCRVHIRIFRRVDKFCRCLSLGLDHACVVEILKKGIGRASLAAH